MFVFRSSDLTLFFGSLWRREENRREEKRIEEKRREGKKEGEPFFFVQIVGLKKRKKRKEKKPRLKTNNQCSRSQSAKKIINK